MRTLIKFGIGFLAGIALVVLMPSAIALPVQEPAIVRTLADWPPTARAEIDKIENGARLAGATLSVTVFPMTATERGSVWTVLLRVEEPYRTPYYVPIAVEIDRDGNLVGVN